VHTSAHSQFIAGHGSHTFVGRRMQQRQSL